MPRSAQGCASVDEPTSAGVSVSPTQADRSCRNGADEVWSRYAKHRTVLDAGEERDEHCWCAKKCKYTQVSSDEGFDDSGVGSVFARGYKVSCRNCLCFKLLTHPSQDLEHHPK
jgi:hypothetical protein